MTATPESIIREWFEELWNKGDETTIEKLLHADGLIHGLLDGRPIRGPAEFKPFYRTFRTAFPDISIELLHVLSEGDMAVAHCRVIGTHRGDGLQIAATNRTIGIEGFAMGRFARGQLIEGWNCFDFLGLYQQLGMQLSPPVSTQPRSA